MKKLIFILLIAGVLLFLAGREEAVTESPPYYRVEGHPIEDTLHIIITGGG